jgi:hypothetical protein
MNEKSASKNTIKLSRCSHDVKKAQLTRVKYSAMRRGGKSKAMTINAMKSREHQRKRDTDLKEWGGGHEESGWADSTPRFLHLVV